MRKPSSRVSEALIAFLQTRETGASSPPSIREVCDALGYRSTNSAMKLIRQMAEDGEVIYEPGRSRSLRLAKKSKIGVPLLGSIAAGHPDTADSDCSESLPVDPTAFGIRNSADAFALRVRGDSMTGRQFFDGDLVLLDRSLEPRHLDVVAALIDHESTLKTLIIRNGKIWLKAENPEYPDLIPAQELEIQGVVKAVIRILAA